MREGERYFENYIFGNSNPVYVFQGHYNQNVVF